MNRNLVKEAFECLETIESSNGSNAKKELLSINSDNQMLKNLIYWTYNPFYRYYLNKFEYDLNEFINPKLYHEHIVEFKEILGRLNARNITGNRAKETFLSFLNRCDSVEQKWYANVISRDLQVGVNVKTINKIWDELIRTFPVALAEKQKVLYYPKRFALQDKYDGYRCLTDNHKSTDMISRNGNELNGYDEITYIMDKCFPKGYMFDGELISSNFKGTQNSAFRKGGGKKADYHIFDVLPRDDFYGATGGMKLSDRQEQLKDIFKFANKQANKKRIDISCIKMVDNILVGDGDNPRSISLADDLYADALNRGLEGVIIKDLDSLYMVGKTYSSECGTGRNDPKWYSWQKRKPSDLHDLTVLDIYEGTGMNVGKLGGVVVDYIGSDGKHYEVGVGSGFKKNEREKYWKHPNLIIGKTIKVEADIESEDSNGNKSLRFTRYKGIRSDK